MSPQDEEQLAEGTLMSHLLELRDRLMKAVLAVLAGCLPAFYFANDLYTFVSQPLRDKLPAGATLIATSVISPFMAPFKLAIWAAVFAAMPVVIYQIWAFVAPGLYRREKKFALPLLVSSILLFYCGVVFAYFVVFPVMFEFFANTTPQNVVMMTDISEYLSFVLTMFFCFGLAFEVPVAVVLLVLTGLVKVEKLRESRGYVLIGIFVVAALLTPPDAISQTIMAVPMYLLYEMGVLFARLVARSRKQAEAKEQAESAS